MPVSYFLLSNAVILFTLFIILYFISVIFELYIRRKYNPTPKWGAFSTLFISFLGSSVICTSLGAIYYSKGITILWGFILAAMLAIAGHVFFNKRSTSAIPEKNNKNEISKVIKVSLFIELILVLTLFFIWYSFYLLSYNNGRFLLSNPVTDLAYYAQVAGSLVHYGQENTFIYANSWSQIYQGTTLYHYYELWATGIVGKLSGRDYIGTFHLCILPLFGLIIYLGGASVLEILGVNKFRNRMIWLISLFIHLHLPFDFLAFNRFFAGVEVLCAYSAVITHTIAIKALGLYPFFIIAFWGFVKRNYFIWWWGLMGAVVASPTLLPPVLGGVGAYLLLSFLRHWMEKNKIIYLSGATFSIVLFYFLFYKFTGNTHFPQIGFMPDLYFTSDFLGILGRMIIKRIMNIGLALSPILFLIAYLYNKQKKFSLSTTQFLCWNGLIFLSGAGVCIVLYQNPDSVQPLNISLGMVLHIGFLYALAKYTINPIQFKIFVPISIMIFAGGLANVILTLFFIHIHEKPQPNQIEPELYSRIQNVYNQPTKSTSQLIGGYILMPDEYKNVYRYHTFAQQRMQYMSYIVPNSYAIDMSILDAPMLKEPNYYIPYARKMKYESFFYQFYHNSKGKYNSVSEAQIDLIKKMNIKYLVVYGENRIDKPCPLPEHLAKLVDKIYYVGGDEQYLYWLK